MGRSYILNVGLDGVYNNLDDFMAGQVVFMASATIPAGWLECNGATVSRATYATLFAAIGTAYGAGDGATTFQLPDLRGEFIRGADRGRGVDTGRAVASAQGDAIRNITGRHTAVDSVTATGAFRTLPNVSTDSSAPGGSTSPQVEFDASLVVPTASENRPRNVAMVACIKY